jgi:hypothetical protein
MRLYRGTKKDRDERWHGKLLYYNKNGHKLRTLLEEMLKYFPIYEEAVVHI